MWGQRGAGDVLPSFVTTLRGQFHLKCPPAPWHSGQWKETRSVTTRGEPRCPMKAWRGWSPATETGSRGGGEPGSLRGLSRQGSGRCGRGWLRRSGSQVTAQAQGLGTQRRRHLGRSGEVGASAHGPRLSGRVAILSQDVWSQRPGSSPLRAAFLFPGNCEWLLSVTVWFSREVGSVEQEEA